MNAAFVGLARWARANGWTPTCTTLDGWRDYRWQKGQLFVHAEPTPSAWHVSVVEPGLDHLQVRVTSVQAAIDHLVTAGVLPAEFRSPSPRCGPLCDGDDTAPCQVKAASRPVTS